MQTIFEDAQIRKAIKEAWNDGYQSAIANALEIEAITESVADDLLTELTNSNE